MIRRWFGFLRLAYAEMIAPFLVALAAALALVLMMIVWVPPRIPPEWALLAPVIAVIGSNFWGWTASFRRLRALEDVPPSNIGTCAQGYARLEGRAAVFPGRPPVAPLISPISRQPCCWYRYVAVTFDAEGDVQSRTSEETDWSFAMRDQTGECIVDPAGAQIFPLRVQRYRDKSQQWTEHVIFPGDFLCVVGHFATAQSGMSDAEMDFRTGQLLAEWKRDVKTLNQRFPPEQATTYSEREWDAVRSAARREVQAAIVREPPQNRVEKPADDRPFIISTESRDDLERDLLIWAWIHALCFVGGVAALAWIYFRFL